MWTVATLVLAAVAAFAWGCWMSRRVRFLSRDLQTVRAEGERAVQAERLLLRNVSYQIRNSADGVLGLTGLVLESPLSHEQRSCLLSAQTTTQSLVELLNNVNGLARADNLQLQRERSEFALGDLLADTIRGFQGDARDKGLKLVLALARGVPESMVSDPIRVRQIVNNLVRNAVQFTPRGEVIVSVTRHPSESALTFQVSDSGVGIVRDRIAGIFDGTGSGAAPLQGLGLAITKRMVESLGGKIGVASAPGIGSRFWFDLPLLPASGASSSALPQPREPRPVLILDPHPASRDVLLSHANQWNGCATANVAVARSIEALVVLDQAQRDGSPFGVLLVDDQLEDRTAMEVVSAVRAHQRFSGLRIILLSSAEHFLDEQSRDRLAFQFLPQPSSRRELWEAMSPLPPAPVVVRNHTEDQRSRNLRGSLKPDYLHRVLLGE